MISATLTARRVDTLEALRAVEQNVDFEVHAHVRVDDKLTQPELRGVASCMVKRKGEYVIVQEAPWRAKRTAEGFTGIAKLHFPVTEASGKVVLYIGKKLVAELPLEISGQSEPDDPAKT